MPKEFDDKELEIIILSVEGQSAEDQKNEVIRHHEKVERLMGIIGAAKYPDTPLTKYDVCDQ